MPDGPNAALVFPIFVGCGRSGTTLIRNIFDAHPSLAVTHEAHFMAPALSRRHQYEVAGGFDTTAFLSDLSRDSNYRRQGIHEAQLRDDLAASSPADTPAAIRAVFHRYATDHGKALYGDKTPGSVNHIALIGRALPETRFVHMVRDGRAVALSYLDRPEWGPQTMGEAAIHWRTRVARGREGGRSLEPHRYLEVRYEDLVEDPERVVAEVCAFLTLDYDPSMLEYHKEGKDFIATTKDPAAFENLAKPVTKEIRDWRSQISDPDVALFESIAGDWLVELGYDRVTGAPSLATRARSLAASVSWQRKRVMSRMTGPGTSSGPPRTVER